MGEPGKDTRTRGPVGTNTAVPDAALNQTVGKRALGNLPQDSESISDRYIQHGAVCDRDAHADGCFLNSGQRERLISSYQQKVLAAQQQYGTALAELRLDVLLEKDDESLPILVEMALDVIGHAASDAIRKAGAYLRKMSVPQALSIADIYDGVSGDQNVVMGLIHDASGEAVWVVNAGVEQGKKYAKKGTTAILEPAKRDNKPVLNYLDEMRDASAMVFERQREDPPGYATDAQLVVLNHSWSAAMGHTAGVYKQRLIEKLDRYKQSGASKVGRQRVTLPATSRSAAKTVVRDTKLVMHTYDDGRPSKLVLYKKDYKSIWFARDLNPREPVTNTAAPIDDEFHEWQPVEPEFEDVAKVRNKEAWGVEFEERKLAVREWNAGVPKPKTAPTVVRVHGTYYRAAIRDGGLRPCSAA